MKKQVTYHMEVRVKRANVEFAPGLGIGVLASQEVTLTVPDPIVHEWMLDSTLKDHGKALLADTIELVITEKK